MALLYKKLTSNGVARQKDMRHNQMSDERRLQQRIRRVAATSRTWKLRKNASERVLPAAAAATQPTCDKRKNHIEDTEQQVCLDQWTSVSCAMTVTRLALHPREHARTLDVVDDRVNEEGALQPRLVPLRVHEGGVHGPVQELLLEQDAVGELRTWRLECSVVHRFFFIHQLCLSPFVQKKKNYQNYFRKNAIRKLLWSLHGNSGSFARSR